MAILLSELQQEVVDYVNRRSLFASTPDPSQFNTTRVDRAINAAIRQITSIVNFRIAEATQDDTVSDGIEAYALPTDFQRMRYVLIKDSNGDVVVKLDYKPPEEFDRYVTVSADNISDLSFVIVTSNPVLYTIEGVNIRIKPKPENSTDKLSQHYVKFLPELSPAQSNYLTDNYPMFCIMAGVKMLLKMLQVRVDETIDTDITNEYNFWLRLLLSSEGLSKSTSFVARRREYVRR